MTLSWRRLVFRLLPVLFAPACTFAQVKTDGTVGPRTTLTGPTFNITPSLGTPVGPNLFHSFETFNIARGQTATFTGPPSVKNILARVTGGQSTIDGTLACPILNANLYLINPAGVIFGPNATLDLHGSFVVTTADYLKLADGGQFHASDPSKSVLTSAAPAAFGFLGTHKPAAIEVRGTTGVDPVTSAPTHAPTLEVQPGLALIIVGGDLAITGGTLRAPEGRIDLQAVRSAGEISAGQAPSTGAAMILTDAILDVAGRDDPGSGSGGNGGLMVFRAGSLSATGSLLSAGGGVGGSAGGAGGRIDLAIGGPVTFTRVFIAADAGGGGDGTGGWIDLTARGSMNLSQASAISASGDGSGGGGRVNLTVDNAVSLSDGSFIAAGGGGVGPGGRIDLTTGGALDLSGGAFIAAAGGGGGGAGGRVDVSAHGDVTLSQASAITAAAGGGIGAGGVLNLTAGGAVNLSQGSLISAGGGGTGGQLVLIAGADVSLLDGSFLSSSGGGSAAGGTIDLTTTGSLTLVNSGISVSGGLEGGMGGQLHVTAAGDVALSQQSFLSAAGGSGFNGSGGGAGGRLLLTAAGAVNLASGAALVADGGIATGLANGGAGGQVEITSSTQVAISSGAFVSAANAGPTLGGSIIIRAPLLLIRDDTTSGVLGTGVRAESTAGVIGGSADLSLSLTVSPFINPAADPPALSLRSPAGSVVSVSGAATPGAYLFADDGVINQQPANPFAAFVGQPRQGLWILEIDNTFRFPGESRNPVTLNSLALALGGETFRAGAASFQVAPGAKARVGIQVAGAGLITGAPGQNVGGPAGTIDIAVDRLVMQGPGQISTASLGTGKGGAVNILARRGVLINGGTIASRAGGTDPAGNVNITSGGNIDLRNATIAAEATGAGGSVTFTAPASLISVRDTTITARAGGDGGRILLSSRFLTLNRSVINGLSGGTPVNVAIAADVFFASESQILTNAALNFPQTDVSGSLITLRVDALTRDAQLAADCGIRIGHDVSSFLISGRGAAPILPGGPLPSTDFSLAP
jgi:filamentous hemagglutinin family protein